MTKFIHTHLLSPSHIPWVIQMHTQQGHTVLRKAPSLPLPLLFSCYILKLLRKEVINALS